MRKTLLTSFLTAVVAVAPFTLQANVPSPIAAAEASVAARVNLNTADAATLQRQLAGIGESKAQAIVAFREQHGEFKSVEELLEVQGIGKALLERNRARLAVN